MNRKKLTPNEKPSVKRIPGLKNATYVPGCLRGNRCHIEHPSVSVLDSGIPFASGGWGKVPVIGQASHVILRHL